MVARSTSCTAGSSSTTSTVRPDGGAALRDAPPRCADASCSDLAAIRQRDGEGRALARLAGHGDVAAQHGGEMFGDGEAEAGAAVIARGRGVGLGEGLEQPADLLRRSCRCRNPAPQSVKIGRPCIRSSISSSISFTSPPLVNFAALLSRLIRLCFSFTRSTFIVPISAGASISRRLPFLSISGVTSILHLGQQAWPRSTVLQMQVHAAGLDLGQIEDVVDQPEQMLAGGLDLDEVAPRSPCRRDPAHPRAGFRCSR